MGVLQRKEREKELRRQQILSAGETLFVQQGLQNTTMEQIANLCEISRGTIYLYFDNKETLFYTLLLKGFDILYSMMLAAVHEEEKVEAKLRAIGGAYLNFYKIHKNYFKLINQFEDQGELCAANINGLMAGISEKTQRIWDLITEAIKEGIKAGIYKEDIQPFETAILLWSSSNGVIQVMEHINSAHKNVYKEHADVLTNDFINIDYEMLLQKLWNMLLSSIRITPVNSNN